MENPSCHALSCLSPVLLLFLVRQACMENMQLPRCPELACSTVQNACPHHACAWDRVPVGLGSEKALPLTLSWQQCWAAVSILNSKPSHSLIGHSDTLQKSHPRAVRSNGGSRWLHTRGCGSLWLLTKSSAHFHKQMLAMGRAALVHFHSPKWSLKTILPYPCQNPL